MSCEAQAGYPVKQRCSVGNPWTSHHLFRGNDRLA